MKKIYFAPKTLMVQVETMKMIAVSDPNAPIDPGTDPIDPSGMEARGGWDLWADDEEAEEEEDYSINYRY